MALRIAAIADTHYAGGSLEHCGARRTAIADTLLLRAVHRLNRFIKPDLTVVLGDLTDDGSREAHERLADILSKLKSPYVVLPGNHDGDPDEFYGIYQRPAQTLDINGARVVTFTDPEQPGYNARRAPTDLARMDAARSGHDGPIISLQHVPLFPPGASASPYGYTNADEVWAAFERSGFTLAISGHWHAGDDLISRAAGRAIIVPALCESPFAFMEIEIDGDSVQTRRHELCLPREQNLIDYHVHTPFAYCSENMDMPLAFGLAGEFGLGGFSFVEHSGQLYFDPHTFWANEFLTDGIATQHGRDERMLAYVQQASEFCPPAYLGLEIDCDDSGNPVLYPEDMARTQIHVGAIHWLQELRKPEPDLDVAADEMLGRLSRFLGCGLQILAHPLRVFRKWPERLPPALIPGILTLLRKHNVAAEINFHIQETSPEFVTACVDAGVKLTFGSDSHNLYEVGEFYPHLELIRRCGFAPGDLPAIMADIRPTIDDPAHLEVHR